MDGCMVGCMHRWLDGWLDMVDVDAAVDSGCQPLYSSVVGCPGILCLAQVYFFFAVTATITNNVEGHPLGLVLLSISIKVVWIWPLCLECVRVSV